MVGVESKSGCGERERSESGWTWRVTDIGCWPKAELGVGLSGVIEAKTDVDWV
jgi:hypothetical protein